LQRARQNFFVPEDRLPQSNLVFPNQSLPLSAAALGHELLLFPRRIRAKAFAHPLPIPTCCPKARPTHKEIRNKKRNAVNAQRNNARDDMLSRTDTTQQRGRQHNSGWQCRSPAFSDSGKARVHCCFVHSSPYAVRLCSLLLLFDRYPIRSGPSRLLFFTSCLLIEIPLAQSTPAADFVSSHLIDIPFTQGPVCCYLHFVSFDRNPARSGHAGRRLRFLSFDRYPICSGPDGCCFRFNSFDRNPVCSG